MAAWKSVRVFVSSTYRDLRAEREHLAQVVFPALRQRCAERGLHFIGVDLRLGIAELEAEAWQMLQPALHEIDRCLPFFIGILGERYGRVLEMVPHDALRDYPWLADFAGRSLCALEITHAVLREPARATASFFYLRDPKCILRIPPEARGDYIPESEEVARRVDLLKQEIRAAGPPARENYLSLWNPQEERMQGLETFGKVVLEDLWAAISRICPEGPIQEDPLDAQRRAHDAFAAAAARAHVGREGETARLSDYVQGEDRRPAVVSGEPGIGKTAFLANWARRYAAAYPEDLVLPYFIGAVPQQVNHFRVLRAMCEEVKRAFSLPDAIPEEDGDLPEALLYLLLTATHRRRVVFVVDGLDELPFDEDMRSLSWLLDSLPEEALLVASCAEGDILKVLRHRKAGEISLPPLTEAERRRVLGGAVDDTHSAMLLALPDSGNPLYLRMALGKLRALDTSTDRQEFLETAAPGVDGLFAQTLARLEQIHGRGVVARAFSLLARSRYGLYEIELLDLLAGDDGHAPVPYGRWACLAWDARAYVTQREMLIGFSHRRLAEAVAARYPEHGKVHTELAAYFAAAAPERKLEEYPYQLQQARKWDALAGVLSDLDFLEYAWAQNHRHEWMDHWRSLEKRYTPGVRYEEALDRLEASGGAHQRVVRLATTIAALLRGMRMPVQAIAFIKRALTIRERTAGPAHPENAACLAALAAFHRDLGEHAESVPLLERFLSIQQHRFGPVHPEQANALLALAEAHRALGQCAEALPYAQRALSIRENALGQDHPLTARSLRTVARILREMGSAAEAQAAFERALEVFERTFGGENPLVAETLTDLAAVFRGQRDYARALPYAQRAVAVARHVLGADNPQLVPELAALAEVYYAMGDYQEAQPVLERALGMQERALAPDNPELATTLNSLAHVHHAQNNFADAAELLQRTLAIQERALGPNSLEVARTLTNLAHMFCDLGQHAQAVPSLQRALAIREYALGTDHPSLSRSLSQLARLYRSLGDFREAIQLSQRALAVDEKACGPHHPEVAARVNDLGLLYYAQGYFAEALPLFQRALRIADAALGPEHPHTHLYRKHLTACAGMMKGSE